MSEPTTQERVAAIRARLDAIGGKLWLIPSHMRNVMHPFDEAFIDHAPADLAFLADEVERLRESEVTALAAAIEISQECESWKVRYEASQGMMAELIAEHRQCALTAQPGAGE